MSDKSYLQFVNLEWAYEVGLKTAWDCSTPYKKKTKGWQGGTHAVMSPWAKDGSYQNQNEGFTKKYIAQRGSAAAQNASHHSGMSAFLPVQLSNERQSTETETTLVPGFISNVITHEVMLVM